MNSVTWDETFRMRRLAMQGQYGDRLKRDMLKFARNMGLFWVAVSMLAYLGGRFDGLSTPEVIRKIAIGLIASMCIGAALRLLQEVICIRRLTMGKGELLIEFGLSGGGYRVCMHRPIKCEPVGNGIVRLDIPLGNDGSTMITVGASLAVAESVLAIYGQKP